MMIWQLVLPPLLQRCYNPDVADIATCQSGVPANQRARVPEGVFSYS